MTFSTSCQKRKPHSLIKSKKIYKSKIKIVKNIVFIPRPSVNVWTLFFCFCRSFSLNESVLFTLCTWHYFYFTLFICLTTFVVIKTFSFPFFVNNIISFYLVSFIWLSGLSIFFIPLFFLSFFLSFSVYISWVSTSDVV